MTDTVAEYLGIPEELKELFLSLDIEYQEDTGSSGEMTYGYYFLVPRDTPEELLEEMEWTVGTTIELPLNIFDEEED